jgi:hypothetical protein
MATLNVASTVTRAGVDTVGSAADATGDEWANTGKEFVEVKNGSGAGITVTLNIRALIDGAAAVNPTVSVGAGQTKIIGPFPSGIYNDTQNPPRARINYSAVASVTVKVLTCVPG